jgi:hypothetical protein
VTTTARSHWVHSESRLTWRKCESPRRRRPGRPMSMLGRAVVAVLLASAATAPLAALTASPVLAATPSPAQGVPGTLELQGIACASASTCEAVGANLDASGNLQGVVVPVVNGIPGSVQVVPASYELEGVACASAATCEAVGFNSQLHGVVLPITNGSPGAVEVVPGTSEFIGVACPAVASCEAVGAKATGTKSRGVAVAITNGRPGRATIVPSTAALLGAACTSLTTCVAVGHNAVPQAVAVTITNGVPGADRTQPETSEFTAVACSSTCLAVGRDFSGPTSYAMMAPIQGGVVGPSQQLASGGDRELSAVACSSGTACQAVGDDFSSLQGVTVAVNNGNPSLPVAVPGTTFLQGVACSVTGTCQAVGVTYSGGASQGVLLPMHLSDILSVVVDGSQVYGSSSPTFTTTTSPPPGDSFTGQLSCARVQNPPLPISASLSAGTYQIDGMSCSGLSLTGTDSSNLSIGYIGGTFTVQKAATGVVAAPARRAGGPPHQPGSRSDHWTPD